MPNSEAIETYNLLRERLGDETARALLRYIELATQANVATKEDLYRLGERLGGDITANKVETLNVREELKGDIAALRLEMTGGFFKVRAILYLLIALILVTNPKIIELLTKALSAFK